MKRKNPYSLVDVNKISIPALSRDRAGQAVVVGVDVAKAELVMCRVWPDRVFERPWRVKSPGQIRLVVSRLLELNSEVERGNWNGDAASFYGTGKLAASPFRSPRLLVAAKAKNSAAQPPRSVISLHLKRWNAEK